MFFLVCFCFVFCFVVYCFFFAARTSETVFMRNIWILCIGIRIRIQVWNTKVTANMWKPNTPIKNLGMKLFFLCFVHSFMCNVLSRNITPCDIGNTWLVTLIYFLRQYNFKPIVRWFLSEPIKTHVLWYLCSSERSQQGKTNVFAVFNSRYLETGNAWKRKVAVYNISTDFAAFKPSLKVRNMV